METCNLSLEVDFMSEIEGQSDNNRLKIHVHHDRKLPTCLYKELEEERSASVDAYIDKRVVASPCFRRFFFSVAEVKDGGAVVDEKDLFFLRCFFTILKAAGMLMLMFFNLCAFLTKDYNFVRQTFHQRSRGAGKRDELAHEETMIIIGAMSLSEKIDRNLPTFIAIISKVSDIICVKVIKTITTPNIRIDKQLYIYNILGEFLQQTTII
ncbi:hypothetical protein YC2023_061079 [Brassica napus]